MSNKQYYDVDTNLMYQTLLLDDIFNLNTSILVDN